MLEGIQEPPPNADSPTLGGNWRSTPFHLE